MITVSILAFSSLFAQAEQPQPHQQKVIIKRSHVITDSKDDVQKEITVTIESDDAQNILNNVEYQDSAEVMGRVKVVTIDENGNQNVQEFDINDMPEGFDVDVHHLGLDSLGDLPPHLLEVVEGELGEFVIDIEDLSDSMHDGFEFIISDERDDVCANCQDRDRGRDNRRDPKKMTFIGQGRGSNNNHGGMWMTDMGNMNMPHMMDMGNMMIVMAPQMGQTNEMPNMRGFNDLHQMHQGRDNHDDQNDVAEELRHRLDDLEGRLDDIEDMLHKLLERR